MFEFQLLLQRRRKFLARLMLVLLLGTAATLAILPRADAIELTGVHFDAEGDVVMPPFGLEWRETAREDFPSEAGRPAYSFVTLERVQ